MALHRHQRCDKGQCPCHQRVLAGFAIIGVIRDITGPVKTGPEFLSEHEYLHWDHDWVLFSYDFNPESLRGKTLGKLDIS